VRYLSSKLDNREGTFVSRSGSRATFAGQFRVMSRVGKAHVITGGRLVLAVVIMSAGFWSGRALAQNAEPEVLPSTASSNSWLLEGPKSNPSPHLVIGMLDREVRSFGGSPHVDARETMLAPDKNGTVSGNSSSDTTSIPTVVSSLSDSPDAPGDRANFRLESASGRPSVQEAPGQGSGIYGFLDETSAEGSFLAADQMKEVLAKQWLESDETFASEDDNASSPLAQFKLGKWQFPVALSTAAVSK
jgi:hypothetical protein